MTTFTRCSCGGICSDGNCSRCKKTRQKHGLHTKTRTERGYGKDWVKLREKIIKERKLCHDCNLRGKAKFAEEVHHIKKIKEFPELRLDPNNLLALCKRCHAIRTSQGE